MSFFKNLGKHFDKAVSDVSREVNLVGRDINRSIDSTWKCPTLDLFRTGNIVQLVSHTSGRSLQIVTSPQGYLVVDGMGLEGASFYHAHWTVVNEGNNVVRLHNNNNYLAIVNGATVIGSFPPPAKPGPESRFQVSIKGNFVTLESMTERGRHIGIMASGELKSALATGKEQDGQFAVRLIHSPSGQPVSVVVVTTNQPPQ